MKNGFGAPYITINTPFGEVSEMVSRFVYKYDQENGDSGQAEINMDNPYIPDKPMYQEGVVWTLIWGYRGEKEFCRRKLKVKEVKVSYTQEGMSISVLLINLADGLKQSSSKEIHVSESPLTLAQKIARKNKLILDFVYKASDYLFRYGTIEPQDNLIRRDPLLPSAMVTEGNYIAAEDNARVPLEVRHGQSYGTNPGVHDFISKAVEKIFPDLPQAGKSDFKILREVLDRVPGGPYEAYGRDEKFVIRKRPLAMRPTKTYHYKNHPHEILTFTPETRNRDSTNEKGSNIDLTFLDEDTQKQYESYISSLTSKEPPIADQKIGNPPDPSNSPSMIGDFFYAATGGYLVDALTDPNATLKTNPIGFVALSFRNLPANLERLRKGTLSGKSANHKAYTGEYLVIRPHSTSADDFNPIPKALTKDEAPPDYVTYKNTYSEVKQETATTDPTQAIAEAENQQAEDEIKTNPGQITILGEPKFKSGVLINIQGVAKKFSGNYYVLSCEHQLDVGSGYIVEASITRNAPNATGEEATDAATVKAEAIQQSGLLKQQLEEMDKVQFDTDISIYKPNEGVEP